MLDNKRVWEPQNYDGSYAGTVTMRDALTHSKNVATVRLADEVGLGSVIGMAEQLGISGVPPHPSIVLGTSEVTPLELTLAYAAFATLGERRPSLRHIVFAQAPETILLIADQAPSFEQTLIQVHPEWVADLQTQLSDLEAPERQRLASRYSDLLHRLGLQLSTNPEDG